MKLKMFTRWIFRGWIVTLLLLLNVKISDSKPTCKNEQYLTESRCCSKCGPGTRLFAECKDNEDTICVPCNADEYQPGWTTKSSCTPQKYCDPGKGFGPRPQNLVSEEPCPCRPNFRCSPINCEYCERIPTCPHGYGLEITEGKKPCLPCKKGFFSNEDSADQCKPWTNCKAQGRSEIRAGTAEVDAVCGPPVSGAAPSWVIVSVLSVITVLCLLILLLFCYKDKIKLLSVNLRSCVQNLKRPRIQQETLAPLYHSGVTGGLPGAPKCTPCETTKLVCQVPIITTTNTDDPLPPFPIALPVKDPQARTVDAKEKEASREKAHSLDLSEGSGEPEEVSDEEGETVSAPVASCGCVSSVQEPLEVGENEDCSQAVDPGTAGVCCCGGADGEERRRDIDKQIKTDFVTGAVSLVSLPASEMSDREVCVPLSKADTKLGAQTLDLKLEEPYKLKCLGSTSLDRNSSVASAGGSVGPLITSAFVGELYQDKATEVSSPGTSCEEKGTDKLSSGDCVLECPPESLQSQLVEPNNTSGQVSGNHNTTFISSGQVMNFSGDVIVVYVSQTSLGNEEAGPEDAFGNPVQEQAQDTAMFFQSSSTENSITQSSLLEQTLPIQEMMDERAPEKRKGTK